MVRRNVPRGAVTVFALNSNSTSAANISLKFEGSEAPKTAWAYILQGANNDILSK